MIILGNIMIGLGQVVGMIITFLTWVIIIHAVLSWVSPDPNNMIVKMIDGLVEPILAPLRKRIPPLGAIDVSPIVALLILAFSQTVLAGTLIDLGNKWKSNISPVTIN